MQFASVQAKYRVDIGVIDEFPLVLSAELG